MQLQGIRIISFNHFLMGPLGMQFLADLGADVIAIESCQGAFQRQWGGMGSKKIMGEGGLHAVANRNKRSLAVDLKSPEGVALVKKLIATADVVSDNFRPGVMDKLGFSFEDLKAINPQIIYAGASGFGPTGPYKNRPGQDMMGQTISGMSWITGTKETGPRMVGVSVIDHHGAMILAAGILGALVQKERTGEGCRVDVNLLSSALDLQAESLVYYFNGKKPDCHQQESQIGSWFHGAPYGIYKASDRYIGLSLGDANVILKLLGVRTDTTYSEADMYNKRHEIAHLIGDAVQDKTYDALATLFEPNGVWYTQVNDYDDVINDPQIQHNGDFLKVMDADGEDLILVANPVRYNGEIAPVRLPPQKLGAQTHEILDEIGLLEQDKKNLIEQGVVVAG